MFLSFSGLCFIFSLFISTNSTILDNLVPLIYLIASDYQLLINNLQNKQLPTSTLSYSSMDFLVLSIIKIQLLKDSCMHAKSLQLCLTVQPCGLHPARLICPWDSPSKNTGLGAPTQGSNPYLLSLPTLTSRFFTTSTTWEALKDSYMTVIIPDVYQNTYPLIHVLSFNHRGNPIKQVQFLF